MKYLLSEPTVTNIDIFQQNCADEGGYLAEIDTEEEYNFIMSFLSQSVPVGRQGALVGATDQDIEGQWVYLR